MRQVGSFVSPVEIRLRRVLGRQPTADEIVAERARLSAASDRHLAERGLFEDEDGRLYVRPGLAERLAQAGVPLAFRGFTLQTWSSVVDPVNARFRVVGESWLGGSGFGAQTLWLWSAERRPGVGKTGLACGLLRQFLSEGRVGVFVRMPRLRAPELSGGSELVVLDDLDKAGLSSSHLWRLCDSVREGAMSVVVTANLSPAEWVEAMGSFGPSALDRLQPVTCCEFTGRSIRTKRKADGKR